MKKETLLKHQNKRARVFLSNGKLYTGRIISVSEDCIELIDKFDLNVTISNDAIQQIELLEEEEEDGRRTKK